MKRWLKFLLLIIGFGVFLLIAAGMTLKFYFNGARLRSLLLPPVSTALGREVDIKSISIDLFRGIKIGGLVVKEVDGKTDFVVIKELGLSYSLRPLLEKRLEIGRIWLEKPTIHIWRNRDGTFNFSDLQLLQRPATAAEPDAQTQSKPQEVQAHQALPVALVVQRCDISGATLTFIDKTGALPQINMTADLMTKLDLGDLKPESIKVVGKLDFKLQAQYKSLTPDAKGTITFDRRKITYKIDLRQKDEACTVSGVVSNYLASQPDIELNLDAARLDLAYLAGLGQKFTEVKNPGAKPAAKNSQVIVKPAAASLAAPQLTARGKINIQQALYENYRVDNFRLNYDYADGRLALNDLRGGLADGQFTGASVIKPFLKLPEFKGDFSLSDLNISLLTAMAAPELKDKLYGTGTGEFKFSGRGATSKALKQNLSLDGKYALRQAGLRKLPLTQALSQLLQLPQLEDLQMAEATGNLRIKQGQLKLNSRWHGEQLRGSAIGDIGLDGGLALPVDLVLSQDLSAKLAHRYAWIKETFNDQGEAEVSIYLDGSVSKPQLKLNKAKVTERLQKKLEDKLLRKLDDKLGAGESTPEGKTGTVKPEDLLRKFLQ